MRLLSLSIGGYLLMGPMHDVHRDLVYCALNMGLDDVWKLDARILAIPQIRYFATA